MQIKISYTCFIVAFSLNLFSCTSQTKPEANLEDSIGILHVNNPTIENFNLSDSILLACIRNNPLWFNSWDWEVGKLSGKDFICKTSKKLDFIFTGYDSADPYLKTYEPYYFADSKNELSIDIYSYNTLLEKLGKDTFVSFDADTKVYLVDKRKKNRAELISVGPYTVIEDCIWLNDTIFILFCYVNEEDERKIPLLWLNNIDGKIQSSYRYSRSFRKERQAFFVKKFANVKIKGQ